MVEDGWMNYLMVHIGTNWFQSDTVHLVSLDLEQIKLYLKQMSYRFERLHAGVCQTSS